MFNISLYEFGIIGVIAMLVLGPREFNKAAQYCKSLIRILKKLINKYITPIGNELNSVKDHIVDLDGNIQPTYDLSHVTNKISHEKKIRKINKEKL